MNPAAAERRCTMSCGNTRGPAAHIEQEVDGFTRRVDFEPGYDCMDVHGPIAGRRCHGRGGMNLRFLLGNDEGVVQFLIYASDWLPGSIEHGSTRRGTAMFGVMAADLGHHWTRPLYESEWSDSKPTGSCEYLDGRPCAYDGSGLNAEPLLVRFLADGLDAVWEDLADYHRSCSEQAAACAAVAS